MLIPAVIFAAILFDGDELYPGRKRESMRDTLLAVLVLLAIMLLIMFIVIFILVMIYG